jgi:hypothetical protein
MSLRSRIENRRRTPMTFLRNFAIGLAFLTLVYAIAELTR